MEDRTLPEATAELHLVHDWRERAAGLGLICLGIRDLGRGKVGRGLAEIGIGTLPYVLPMVADHLPNPPHHPQDH